MKFPTAPQVTRHRGPVYGKAWAASEEGRGLPGPEPPEKGHGGQTPVTPRGGMCDLGLVTGEISAVRNLPRSHSSEQGGNTGRWSS